MYQQLPLSFQPREAYTFDTLTEGPNALVFDSVRKCALGDGEQQLYCWSQAGGGKSHLLQAACQLAAKKLRSVCYFPLDQIIHQSADVFNDLEQLDLVCLDNIECIARKHDWEQKLFDLINRLRETGRCLLLAANAPPDGINVALPDLISRLSWGPVFQLLPLNDADKVKALSLHAELRGLQLPGNVADYLMHHYPRDMFSLFEHLDTLDEASLAMQRKLTIPFVKTVLK